MSDQPEVLVSLHASVGEGPVWQEDSGTVLWIDMEPGLIYQTSLESGATSTMHVDTYLGAVVPRARGGFAAAHKTGFAMISANGELSPEPAILAADHRMNDAKCDPLGRFWAGSTQREFEPGAGALHVLERDHTSRVVLEGLALPNGMGWSADARSFYLNDTTSGEVLGFDFDAETGALSAKRLLHHFPFDQGMPDGLCIDTDGCLWMALWGGFAVVRLSPEGELLRTIRMPVAQPSSCAFGGASLDVLIVTSAANGIADAGEDTLDGAVFAIRGTGCTGVPVASYAG